MSHSHGGNGHAHVHGPNCNHGESGGGFHQMHSHGAGASADHAVVNMTNAQQQAAQQRVQGMIESGQVVGATTNSPDNTLMFGVNSWSIFDIAKSGNTDALEVAVQDGVDLYAEDEGGATVMHWAAMSGEGGIITFLCKKGLGVNAKAKGSGNNLTPLMWAVNHHHVVTVKELIEMGADLEARDRQGYTALMYAGMKGHVHLMHCLIEAGAQVTTQDDARHTLLHWAVYKGQSSTVNYLAMFHAHVCKMCEIDDIERNAVHWACRTGHLDCTRTLAAINPVDFVQALAATDDEGKTPMQLASQHGHVDIIKWVECMTKISVDGTNSNPGGAVSIPRDPNDQRKALLFSVASVTQFFKAAGGLVAFFTIGGAALPLLVTLPLAVYFIIRVNKELSHSVAKSTPLGAVNLQLPGMWCGMGLLGFMSIVFGHFMLGLELTLGRCAYLFFNLLLVANFVQLGFSEPGLIPASKKEMESVISELVENDGVPQPWISPKAMLRLPPRSKFSTVFGARVGRYDHHCFWLQNVIGYKNHKSFMSFIMMHVVVQVWHWAICYSACQELDAFHLSTVVSISRASLYLCLMVLNGPLIPMCLYMVVAHFSCIGNEITSHEAQHYQSLWYLQTSTSPYSRGSRFKNLAGFFGMKEEYGDPFQMPPRGSVVLPGDPRKESGLGLDLEWWNPVEWMQRRKNLKARRVMERPGVPSSLHPVG